MVKGGRRMRKWVSLIAILTISGIPLQAEGIQQPVNEITAEVSQNKEVITYLSRQLFNTILEEQQLSYLMTQTENQEISLKEAAYALCQMLNEAGIYLPESEGISDPYIGKLVLLGIWQESELNGESLMTSEVWERTYERVLYYQESQQAFTRVDTKKEKTMMAYRQKTATSASYEEIEIGKLTLSNQVLAYGAYTYPLYIFANTSYIDLNTLEALGFTFEKQPQGDVLSFTQGKERANEPVKEKSIAVSLSKEKIYYSTLKTYALKSEHGLFIPLRILEMEFNLKYDTAIIGLEVATKKASYLSYQEGLLHNSSGQPIEVVTTSYYWDGEKIIQEMKRQHLEVGQSIENPSACYVLRGAYYLNTLVNLVETQGESYQDEKLYGQQMESILKAYEKARLAEIKKREEKKQEDNKQSEKITNQEVFPPAPVYATLKVDAKGLKKGEQVEIYREDNGGYTVITQEGKKVTIPRSKLIIPYDQKVTAAPASKVQIETYINTQNIASDTEYLVWTDLYRQTTYVLKGSKNEWLLVKRMICSTGKNLTPTPRGFFTLKNKVPSFGQEKGYSCKNAYGFIGSTYLYHSILYDKTGSYIISGKKELGQKASHGCIRLLPEDSLWLYTNMPKGTKVWIN